MKLIIRISIVLILIICYKNLPVFEPVGINYILSLFNLGLIAYECKKTWNLINFNTVIKNLIQSILYFTTISIILFYIIFIIHKTEPVSIIRFIRAILIIALMIAGGKIINIISKSDLSSFIKNTCLVLFSTFSFISLIEIIFMFISLSHGSGEAYSGKIWGSRYWNPINKYGLRDEEPKNGKQNVFFIGDSFTAGWGVKNIKNRFGEITAEELKKKGRKINEINLGRFGADTKLEYSIFKKFIERSQIKPDHIVLQFFVNDMDKFFPSNKKCIQKPLNLSTWKETIIKGSYLANYIHSLYPEESNGILPKECEYIEILKEVYNNDSIWMKEQNQLNKFKNYCLENKIKMTLVFFPLMEDLNFTEKSGIEKRIKNYCTSNNIIFFNVKKYIKNLSRNERQVSITDSHASAKVHEITGKNLAKYINF